MKRMKRSKTFVNWANLDGNLVNVIWSKLVGEEDGVNFCLVCPQWKAAVEKPLSPWLVHYHKSNDTWNFSQHNASYHRRFPDPESREACLHCSKHGWWLMSWKHDYSLFLFDPSNNRKLELPDCIFEDDNTCEEFKSLQFSFFNPPTSPDCVAVGISDIVRNRDVRVYTLRRGGDKGDWRVGTYRMRRTKLFRRSLRSKSLRRRRRKGEFHVHRYRMGCNKVYFQKSLSAPVMHGGRVFFLSERGDVAVLDLNSRERRLDVFFDCLSLSPSEESPKEQYLIKVNWEEKKEGQQQLFGVFVFGDDKVSVCRLSSEMKWVSVEGGIGDKVLYVSHAASWGFKAPTKSGLENTVCFPFFHNKNNNTTKPGSVSWGFKPHMFYSLSDSMYRSVDGAFSSDKPGKLERFHYATWIMPMPTEEITIW